MAFDELYKKVIDAQRAFEERHVPISLDFKIEDLRDALVESNDTIEKIKAENERLKRALWIAHKYKAKFKRWWLHLALDYEASMIRPDTKTIKRIKGKIENCEKSERKCRAKAEEYK